MNPEMSSMRKRKPADKERHIDVSAVARPSLLRRRLALLTLIAYIGQPFAATAEIIAAQNAAAGNRPTVDVTANGLPLVQIASPSAAGVSHNQYNQYNVDPAGAILNNSQSTVLTQQAGYVSANPNLATGSARIILNEVTSTHRSQLNGYTEVAGRRADVIIANPNGITCNGCGFINTSRGVLTTGTPVMGTGGSLDAFRVAGGDIRIGSAGLNGSNLNQLDLIARSVQVNGQLWAGDLNVITGANQVGYNTLGVQLIQGTGTQPTVGIDVALLGGMYANKIRLIGTEAGVGVNSAGNLAAQAGDFTLDNAGQITLSGSTTASGNLTVNSNTGISNSGTLYSQQTTQLATTGDISNTGRIAGNTVETHSNNFNNTATVMGNVLNLHANNLNNLNAAAFIGATQTVNLIIANALNNQDGATLYSLGDINIGSNNVIDPTTGYVTGNAVSVNNQSATIEAAANLRISANSITNQRTVVGVEFGPSWTGTPVVNTPLQGGPSAVSYTPTYANQQFTAATTPAARLLSGADMYFGGGTLNNSYSDIIAGGTLTAQMTIGNDGPELLKSETRTGVTRVWSPIYHPQQGHCGRASWGCVHAYVEWVLVTANFVQAQPSIPISGLNYTSQDLSPSAYLAAKSNSTITLPASGLYTIHSQPGQPYLVATDPRFTSYQNFISSDYLLSRLALDPQTIQKRLGDGFYEQKLVNDQVTAATGRRYLGDYSDAQAQFIALLNSGVDTAQ